MDEAKATFESRVSRLANYLTRAYKYNEFLRSDVEKSLKRALVEQGLEVVSVDAGNNKDLPAFFSSTNSGNSVFSVYNMDKGFPEVLQYLNFKREELVEHHVKAVFWVREEELARISLDAPDFFAFRNRVVEFMEVPTAEERRPALVEFALETEYKSLDEIKRSIELKEKLLSELSTEAEISGYLLSSLGILYGQIGSYNKSLEYSEKALKVAKEIGDRQNEGSLLGNLGIAYSNLGQVERAIEYYEQALAIAKEIGDRRSEGTLLGNLGIAYSNLGQVERAIEYYEQALAIAKEIGDRRGEGDALGNLGIAYSDLGQVERAIKYYEQALTVSKEIGNRRGEGDALGNLGIAYSDLGQVERAIKYYEQALAIAKEIGDRRGEGTSLNNLGVAFMDMEKYDLALACYLLASEIRREIRAPEIKTTENNISRLKTKIGKSKFQKLMATVEPKAEEIIHRILTG
jgi:tetratricopeptide (TPR) repeat protein